MLTHSADAFCLLKVRSSPRTRYGDIVRSRKPCERGHQVRVEARSADGASNVNICWYCVAVGDAGGRNSLCRNSHCPGRARIPCWTWAKKADSPPPAKSVSGCGGNWPMSGSLHWCCLWVVYLSRVVTYIV
ncbi:mCG147535 [Mus musculus]|nr:mCG147535 [Mus musculus]